jgi:DNA/RNA-binding protein KIN17
MHICRPAAAACYPRSAAACSHPLLQIANRIKSKGLQKLRWYCQLCQKQCRDENGFKCHQMSEGHRRQMEVFGQNPDRVVEGYSEEFERSFLDHLRRA